MPITYENKHSQRKLTEKYWYPTTETKPAKNPMSSAPQGWITMSATDPTATPPANVAFWMWVCVHVKKKTSVIIFSRSADNLSHTMLSFLCESNTAEKMNVEMTLPVKEKYVLIIALFWALPEASAELKLGQ